MTKAVIFDLDGLLINSEVISHQIIQKFVEPFGYEVTMSDYADHYSGRSDTANIRDVIERFSLPYDLESGLTRSRSIEAELLAKGVELKRGAKELLEYAKTNGYQIALASSSTGERAMSILKQHDIADYFDVFVFGDEIERGKPHPDIFLKACEKLGEQEGDCLVLEDSEAGVRAALRAGISVICIPDLKPPLDETLKQASAVHESLLDVIDYLKHN